MTVSAASPAEIGVLVADLEISRAWLVDPASGDIVFQQPVVQLRNVWDRQLSCQAAVVGTRIVAVCGGTW